MIRLADTWNSKLTPMVGCGNDWTLFEHEVNQRFNSRSPESYTRPVSIVIPVYNRIEKLGKTIAALTHSTYPLNLMEIIIADDGSSDNPEQLVEQFQTFFPIKYVQQSDKGFRAARIRNKGVALASHEDLIFLDCDMLPEPTLVEGFMKYLHVSNKIVLLGGRRYVNTDAYSIQDVMNDIEPILNLPSQCADTGRGPEKDEPPTEDWRYAIYRNSDYLKNEIHPFNNYCAGNIGISKQLFLDVGGFDESFVHWGMEDTEIGYRLYRKGAWFIPVEDAKALHQEPPGGSNETNRMEGREITEGQFVEKCPAKYRPYVTGRAYEIPKVSVYIPAYNCEQFIKEAIDSVLSQTYTDLEVVICNDGSTDGTHDVLVSNFGNNPQVTILFQENQGISAATNTAINSCRGEYILQLDADDLLLANCVESLVGVMDSSSYDFVYGDSHLIGNEGEDLGPAYSWSLYCRFRLLNGMFIHHPRMFRASVFSRTMGFNESLSNAVDFDFYLQLSQHARGYHLQKPLYLYRQHSTNTSKVNRKQQDNNTHVALQRAFDSMGLGGQIELLPSKNDVRKLEKELRLNNENYSINFAAIYHRMGIRSPTKDGYMRWQFEKLVSVQNQRLFEQDIAAYKNIGKRYLRVGPFGSPDVTQSVRARLRREYVIDVGISVIQQKTHSQYFALISHSGPDSESIQMARNIRAETNWPVEIIRRKNAKFNVRIRDNNEDLVMFFSRNSIADNEEHFSYNANQFWIHENDTLIFRWKDHEVFFEMPHDWTMTETHLDLFQLAHHLMVEPWDKSAMTAWNPTRQPGWRPGLAFSGGIDSAAAMALMPEETVLLYNERAGISGQLNHTNAFRFFEKITSETGRVVHRIRSNHEQLRAFQGKSVGFSTDYACAVQNVLLADYFGLDSISTGMPLENSYLFHGYRYRDFADSWFWKHYAPMFESVGLPLYQPVAGCSEVINLNIVIASGWDGWAQSCLRSTTGGKVCGGCWKCFRKNTLQGLPFRMSNEINTFLSKEPLKQAASTIYSIQKGGISKKGVDIRTKFTHLSPFFDMDLSFLERYLEDSLELLPPKYRKFTESKLKQYALPMGKIHKKQLQAIDFYNESSER
mgnify:CR=1 FL=1